MLSRLTPCCCCCAAGSLFVLCCLLALLLCNSSKGARKRWHLGRSTLPHCRQRARQAADVLRVHGAPAHASTWPVERAAPLLLLDGAPNCTRILCAICSTGSGLQCCSMRLWVRLLTQHAKVCAVRLLLLLAAAAATAAEAVRQRPQLDRA